MPCARGYSHYKWQYVDGLNITIHPWNQTARISPLRHRIRVRSMNAVPINRFSTEELALIRSVPTIKTNPGIEQDSVFALNSIWGYTQFSMTGCWLCHPYQEKCIERVLFDGPPGIYLKRAMSKHWFKAKFIHSLKMLIKKIKEKMNAIGWSLGYLLNKKIKPHLEMQIMRILIVLL